jgi:ankyrin repeat protein
MFPTAAFTKTLTHNEARTAGSRDLFGNTPLHRAVCCGRADSAALLISMGADVNARDDAGATPLHQAILAGDNGIAALLIGAGADPSVATDQGVTALQLARLYGRLSNPSWRRLLA